MRALLIRLLPQLENLQHVITGWTVARKHELVQLFWGKKDACLMQSSGTKASWEVGGSLAMCQVEGWNLVYQVPYIDSAPTRRSCSRNHADEEMGI